MHASSGRGTSMGSPRLRALDRGDLRRTVGEFVSDVEIDGILSRRDGIVGYFDHLVRKNGERAVIRD